MKNVCFLILFSVVLYGCSAVKYPSSRLGQFTVISSDNIRNLHYSSEDKTKVRTKGEDCYDIEDGQPNDARLQRALDNAIQNGKAKGVDGDILVNARIDQKVVEREGGFLGIGSGVEDCMIVEGDLVKLK